MKLNLNKQMIADLNAINNAKNKTSFSQVVNALENKSKSREEKRITEMDPPTPTSDFEKYVLHEMDFLSETLMTVYKTNITIAKQISALLEIVSSEDRARDIKYKEAMNSFMLPNN